VKITKGDISFEATDGGEWYGFWPSVQEGTWEPHTFQVFDRFLDKDHSYVDIGAWIGPTVMYGCQLAKHCYTVEPDPVALKMLHKHLGLNEFENVTVFEGAISDKNGKMTLGCRANNQQWQLGESMTSVLFGESSFTVSCYTLQEYFRFNGINDCNFIKMDIEGGEVFVLPQACPFLEELGLPLYMSFHGAFLTKPQRQTVALTLKDYRLETWDGSPLDHEVFNSGQIFDFLVFFE